MEIIKDDSVEGEDKSSEDDEEITKEEEESDEFYIKDDLIEFSTLLNEDPQIEYQIREVFEHYLKDDTSAFIAFDFINALELLIPEGSARLISNSCRKNSNEFLSKVEKIATEIPVDSKKSIRFLKLVTALYGNTIKSAFRRYNNYHDWKWAKVCLCNEIENGYFIDLNLLKYNGEKLFLKMDLSSSFNFICRLIEEINKLSKEDVIDEISDENLEIITSFYEKYLCDDDE